MCVCTNYMRMCVGGGECVCEYNIVCVCVTYLRTQVRREGECVRGHDNVCVRVICSTNCV